MDLNGKIDTDNIDDSNIKTDKIILKYNEKKLKNKSTSALISFFVIFIMYYIIYEKPQFIYSFGITERNYSILNILFAIFTFIIFIININIINKSNKIIIIENKSLIFLNIFNSKKNKSIDMSKIKNIRFNKYTNNIILKTDKKDIKIDIRMENMNQFINYINKNLNPNAINNDVINAILIKLNFINDKKYKALYKINKLKTEGKYKKILKYCKHLKPNMLADVLYYLFSSKLLDDFNLCRYILENNYKDIKILPMLEKVELSKERFLIMLDTIIKITDNDFVNINAFMYIILLNNSKYFKDIDNDRYSKIVNNLTKVKNMIQYIQKVNNNVFINFLVEQHIKAIKYFNNQELLVMVLQFLKYGNNEVKIYAVDTLLYNDMFIKDEYIELLAADPLYMNILYSLLADHKKIDLFPNHYINQDNFAIADFTEWIAFSTSIKKAPSDIEIITDFEYNGFVYYIFKFSLDILKINKKYVPDEMIGISGGYLGKDMPTPLNNGYTYTLFEAFDDNNYKKQAIKIINKVTEIKQNNKSNNINK